MENFKITKEQILELENGFTLPKLKQWFPDAFKVELEVGKWYKRKDKYCNWLMNFQKDNTKCYRFNSSNKYDEDYLMIEDEGWNEATEQEVFEALKNEAVKRGFKNNLELVKCLLGFSEDSSQEYYKKLSSAFYFEKYANKLWIQGGSYLDICIFDNGTWATIIETITKEEAGKLLNKKIV